MRRARAFAAAALFAPAVGAHPIASAPIARLELQRSREAARCPDEAALRAAVTRRLGRDPFDPRATQTVRVAFDADGSGLALSIDVTDHRQALVGRRLIRSRSRDCGELAESAAVAIVVAIDVLAESAARQPPAPIEPQPPASIATQPQPTDSLPAAPSTLVTPMPAVSRAAATDALAGALAIDAVVSIGDLPLVAFGAALRGGVRLRSLGVYLEGRATLPTTIDAPMGARIESTLFNGALLSCFHRAWFAACGVGAVGALLARGSNVERPREPTIAVLAAGARAAGQWRVSGGFTIDVGVEVLASIVRPVLVINSERAWDAPPLQGSVRIGVGVELR